MAPTCPERERERECVEEEEEARVVDPDVVIKIYKKKKALARNI